MSTIYNDRDVILQATSPRYASLYTGTPVLLLTSNVAVFQVTSGGVATPTSATLTAKLMNMAGTVSWSASGATVTPAGETATVTYASMTGVVCTITAQVTYRGVVYSASYTIVKAVNGTNGTNGNPGTNGIRGSRQFYVTPRTSWSDAVATSTASVDGGPVLADSVVQYDTPGASGFTQTRAWNGSSWVLITQVVDGSLLVTASVLANAIYAGSFTGYTITGSIIQTATSGQRVVINAGAANRLQFYNSSGTLNAEMGGGVATFWATGGGFATSTIQADHAGPLPVITGHGTSAGAGMRGISSSGYGGMFQSTSSFALSLAGGINCSAYSAGTPGRQTMTNDCYPVADNAYELGSASNRWAGITSASAVIVTSDRRSKIDIEDSDLGLDFLLALRPVSYRMRESIKQISRGPEQAGPWLGDLRPEPEVIVTPKPGVRRHYGLLAQDVRQALGNKDAAFWVLTDAEDKNSSQALRYEELISPIIKGMQQLAAEVTSLRAELAALKAKP